jgi:protein SCO1/2
VTACRCFLALAAAIGFALSLTAPAASDARVAFRLTTQHGTAFTDRDIDGAPSAIFFGFTNCPDVCPTTLLQMTQDLEELGPDGDKIKVVFISVDPERDAPARLAAYMASFDPRIVALTGAEDVIAAVARAYGASYRKVPAGGSYTIDHTASVFLLDRAGEYVGALTHADSRSTRLEKLRRLLP